MATCVNTSPAVPPAIPPAVFIAAHAQALRWALKHVDYDTAHDLANEVTLSVLQRTELDPAFLQTPGRARSRVRD